MSELLLGAGALALVLAAVVPGWDTARLPKRAVKRRIYWTGSAVGAVLLFLGGLPDLQSSVAFVIATTILMTGWAYSRNPPHQDRWADPVGVRSTSIARSAPRRRVTPGVV